MGTFKDLKVWEKAHEMVLEIYRVTISFPQDEKYGLVSQIRRAASSVPTNIVEGHKRNSQRDNLHFLNIADCSLEETKYQLLLSFDLGYISKQMYEKLIMRCEEVGKMLYGLQRNLGTQGKS